VTVGEAGDLLAGSVRLSQLCWVNEPVAGAVEVQTSAHGEAVAATFDGETVRFAEPQRRVAPGQSVVLYRGDEVLGGGIAVQ
jgi:tRNA-uridine 2-sulfurtransferase